MQIILPTQVSKRRLTSGDMKVLATANRAWSGQGKNQSILALFTIPGKLRHLVLNVSPTGDMAITMCRLLEHLVTKYCHMLSLAGAEPAFVASFLI